MIRTTWRSGMWVGSTLLNSKLYKAAKRKGVWYYRLFISDDFAKTMGNIYDLNVMERKLKGLSKLKKRVFNVDDNGNIWDPTTGEIFGNVNTIKTSSEKKEPFFKTEPKPDFDFESTVGDLIVKHYEYETASEILAKVCQDLYDIHRYDVTKENEDQITDMINEYTESLR